MRRILLIMAMLLVCAMCFAKTYGLTLHLHSYVPPRAEVAWNGEEPVVVSNFSESATGSDIHCRMNEGTRRSDPDGAFPCRLKL